MSEQMTIERVLPRPAEQPALPAAAAPAALRPEVEPWEAGLWPEYEDIPDDEMDEEC